MSSAGPVRSATLGNPKERGRGTGGGGHGWDSGGVHPVQLQPGATSLRDRRTSWTEYRFFVQRKGSACVLNLYGR